ncbi:unnamed protein product [Brachionus calyciflorus]|uniref:Uncharacterized protein n=1 Tax=Brachionus calyciflorus TaxID=104777 RepID=A0A814D820_9BILA|nr:unnamed protein product [Brachionus calyciflorus]
MNLLKGGIKLDELVFFERRNGIIQKGRIIKMDQDKVLVTWNEQGVARGKWINISKIFFWLPECKSYSIWTAFLITNLDIFRFLGSSIGTFINGFMQSLPIFEASAIPYLLKIEYNSNNLLRHKLYYDRNSRISEIITIFL